ncbi:MAG: ADP-ribosylglycohydrolase family protein [Oscillospiraceae bacterium]
MNDKTIEKIYAGLLGMDAGMRLGAPVENPWWTYERLRDYFGEIRGYLREQKTHPADDDVNGPAIFVRALTDHGGLDFTSEEAGETWLNYTRCGKGMFWWGGEELSTEHRAFMNLKRGVPAPESGCRERNGRTASEQIGGQIFVDTWGLVCPGDPEKAAHFARKMASVSHDGEGLHGAAFMAAAVAAAFEAADVDAVIDAGLTQLPADCAYRRVVENVRAFHAAHPDDFRACRDYVEQTIENPGGWHILPNAGICLLALLYGGGDLGRSIEIAVMCGFDTDCNASSVGTILGVLNGIDGLPERYRRPINDSVVLSSVSGYLNMLDVPTFAKELASAACRLRGETVPTWAVVRPGELDFDFAFPGSTHGLELSDKASYELRWRDAAYARTGRGCLEMQMDGKYPAPTELTFRACCLRGDFESERYEPVFAPRVYPGQTVTIWLRSEQTAPATVTVTPFVTRAVGERIVLAPTVLAEGAWTEVSFAVPDLGGDRTHALGWRFEAELHEPPWAWGKVFIDRITVRGAMDYTIDGAKQGMEFGEPTPFSTNDGEGVWEDGTLVFRTEGVGQAFTGNYYMSDTAVEADAEASGGACLLLRGQGVRRYYALGFSSGGVSIVRREAGERTALAAAPFARKPGRVYHLTASAKGNVLALCVDGRPVLTAEDDRFGYGMAGVCHETGGESRWSGFHIQAGL